MYIKRRNTRHIEICTGFFLILSVLFLLLSFILNFDYTVPDATIEEDIEFLIESISSQKTSAYAWIFAGIANLILLPYYFIIFHRFRKVIQSMIGLFILIMAFCFFNIGLNELNICKISVHQLGLAQTNMEAHTLMILSNIREIAFFQRIGITAFGAFATLVGISRLDYSNFSLLGSFLNLISGPVIIIFTWMNPDHIILTTSLALAWTGILIIGARMINRGLEIRTVKNVDASD